MTILVDETMYYPNVHLRYKHWCHMGTDDLTANGLIELNAMATRLHLQLTWFQDRAFYPHYDLTPSKRKLAVSYGAQEVSKSDWVKRCRRKERHAYK